MRIQNNEIGMYILEQLLRVQELLEGGDYEKADFMLDSMMLDFIYSGNEIIRNFRTKSDQYDGQEIVSELDQAIAILGQLPHVTERISNSINAITNSVEALHGGLTYIYITSNTPEGIRFREEMAEISSSIRQEQQPVNAEIES